MSASAACPCQQNVVRKLRNSAEQSYLLDYKTDSDRSAQNACVFIEERSYYECFFLLQPVPFPVCNIDETGEFMEFDQINS